jgi:hypothetical protein
MQVTTYAYPMTVISSAAVAIALTSSPAKQIFQHRFCKSLEINARSAFSDFWAPCMRILVSFDSGLRTVMKATNVM